MDLFMWYVEYKVVLLVFELEDGLVILDLEVIIVRMDVLI